MITTILSIKHKRQLLLFLLKLNFTLIMHRTPLLFPTQIHFNSLIGIQQHAFILDLPLDYLPLLLTLILTLPFIVHFDF